MQRILIVDDNEDIREVLGTYVAKEGFEPVVAKDGFEALDLFKKANPAVVLLDVMMPEWMVTKFVKKSASSRMCRLSLLQQKETITTV